MRALGSHVVGVDIDADALSIMQDNVAELELDGVIDLYRGDVAAGLPWRGPALFDTVVMNPPFGNKTQRGIDMVFLRAGLDLARGAVYSLHKSSTREHIQRKAREWGATCEVVAELRYNLQATYRFHTQRSVDIEVDLIRVARPKAAS